MYNIRKNQYQQFNPRVPVAIWAPESTLIITRPNLNNGLFQSIEQIPIIEQIGFKKQQKQKTIMSQEFCQGLKKLVQLLWEKQKSNIQQFEVKKSENIQKVSKQQLNEKKSQPLLKKQKPFFQTLDSLESQTQSQFSEIKIQLPQKKNQNKSEKVITQILIKFIRLVLQELQRTKNELMEIVYLTLKYFVQTKLSDVAIDQFSKSLEQKKLQQNCDEYYTNSMILRSLMLPSKSPPTLLKFIRWLNLVKLHLRDTKNINSIMKQYCDQSQSQQINLNKNQIKGSKSLNISLESKLGKKIVELFVSNDYQELIYLLHIKKISDQIDSNRKKQFQLVIELLVNKFKYYQGQDVKHYDKHKFLNLHYCYIKRGRQQIQNRFMNAQSNILMQIYYDDVIFLIARALVSDTRAIKRICNGDWIKYILIYAITKKPLLSNKKIFGKIRNYLAENVEYISERQMFLIYLTQHNYHAAYQYSRAILPPQLCATLGMIAWRLNLLPQQEIIDQFQQMNYYTHILQNLSTWMMQVPWDLSYPYLRQLINQQKRLRINQEVYRDFLLTIIYTKIQFQPIQTVSQLQKLMLRYKQVVQIDGLRQLNLGKQHLRKMIKFQIKESSFKYLFNLINLYSRMDHTSLMLQEVTKICYNKLNDDTFNFKQLVKIIQNLQKQKLQSKILAGLVLNQLKIAQIKKKFRQMMKLVKVYESDGSNKQEILKDVQQVLRSRHCILGKKLQSIQNLLQKQIGKDLKSKIISKVKNEILRIKFQEEQLYNNQEKAISKFNKHFY